MKKKRSYVATSSSTERNTELTKESRMLLVQSNLGQLKLDLVCGLVVYKGTPSESVLCQLN